MYKTIDECLFGIKSVPGTAPIAARSESAAATAHVSRLAKEEYQ